MELPEDAPQQTDVYGWLSEPTRLPWKFLWHIDFQVMIEFENHYRHDPSGAGMVIHCWHYPRRCEQKFSWKGQEFQTEEELIRALTQSGVCDVTLG